MTQTQDDDNYSEFSKIIQLRDELISDPQRQNDMAIKRLKIERMIRKTYSENSDYAINVRNGRYDLINDENLTELYTPIRTLSNAYLENYKTRKQREMEDQHRERLDHRREKEQKHMKFSSDGTSPVLQNITPASITPQPQTGYLPPLNGSLNISQFVQQHQQPAQSQRPSLVDNNGTDNVQSQLQLLQNLIHLQNQQQHQLQEQQQKLYQTQESLNIYNNDNDDNSGLESLGQLKALSQLQQAQMIGPPAPPSSAPPPLPTSAVSPIPSIHSVPAPSNAGYIPPHQSRRLNEPRRGSDDYAPEY